MALTIGIKGKGVIANCDALTNDTGGTGTGDWSEQGGGTMSLTTDVYLYGSSSIAGKYASKSGFQQFDIGSGNELDFDTAGTEEDQFIYMWVNLSTFGVLDTLANSGLAIRISSSSPGTSNYKDYVIAGSDGANGWTGGWKLFVIDPTKAATASSGTCDIGAIRTIGVWIDTAESVRAESLFIDQIAVGSGLVITGTSTSGWVDAVNYCTDYSNRAWGMLQEVGGIAYAFGKIYIGDSANQSANVSFADSGAIIQFGTSQYWTSGSGWVSTFDIDGAGIVIEDHASYSTEFIDGVLVGTDGGRSGSTIIGNDDQDVKVSLYGGNNSSSLTKLYGTTLKELSGGIIWGDDVDHHCYSVNINKCEMFEPLGAIKIRNCVFSETTSTLGAVHLPYTNADIEECQFIANVASGMYISTSNYSPYTFTSLVFSGNTFDVRNNGLSSVVVNLAGTSNASTYDGISAVTFLSSATLRLVVKDENNAAVGSAYAYIDDDNITPFIMNTTTNATTGIAEVDWTGGAKTGATWRVRKYGYKPFKVIADVPATGTKEIPVTLIADPQQS